MGNTYGQEPTTVWLLSWNVQHPGLRNDVRSLCLQVISVSTALLHTHCGKVELLLCFRVNHGGHSTSAPDTPRKRSRVVSV